jgi:hypothetical protein
MLLALKPTSAITDGLTTTRSVRYLRLAFANRIDNRARLPRANLTPGWIWLYSFPN